MRFGIGMLMAYFLDEDFDEKYLTWVANAKLKNGKKALKKELVTTYSVDKNPDEYYVEMMKAWYFATALAKRFKETIPFIKDMKLNPWTHNKTIQKAIESYRISDKLKEMLRKLKV